ncbi:MAG: ABC transporter ATP-binding protein [Oscillospiraceae bacterium]|nr:ABC transporter ATP-binding protein [Oscillospiraceae bacterium]
MDNQAKTAAAPDDIVLSMENITKIYDNGFVANKDINFSLRRGEIHGLLGENGAGKTTLMKVLFGHEKPERGRILLNNQEIKIDSPLKAIEYGIGMVHQHFMLVDNLTVAENMVLGNEPTKAGAFFDKEKAIALTNETAQKFNLPIDPTALIKDLSVGYKQRVEILKVLLRGVKILILDEPTAVLTPQETEELFIQLMDLKKKDFTIVFISHKLNEVKRICDRITVLRSGEVSGTADVADVTVQDMSRMMVGRTVMMDIDKKKATPGKSVLKVRDLVYTNRFGIDAVKNVSFDLRAGEILGVAGVEGNGQSELSDILSGLIPLKSGSVTLEGKNLAGMSIHQIREAGVALIHEDRMIYGVSVTQSIAENLVSERFFKPPYSRNGVISLKEIGKTAEELIEDFTVKCDGPDAPVKTLSGGNVQKVVAARECSSKPQVMIANQPTRGIDVGATELIRNKIVELRDKYNTATLLISADLTELLTVCDSIIVMYDGEIVAYFPDLEGVTENILGEYMLGIKKGDAENIGGVLYE